MSSLLLDIEIAMDSPVIGVVIALILGYLGYLWWSTKKVAASGVSSASSLTFTPINLKGTATPKAGSSSSDSNGAKLPLSIFFGSQSGTAETFAHELAEEGKVFGFKAVVHDLQDYDRDSLADEKFCVFLMSTFGEGDPTDNAAEFYEWINAEEREKDLLQNVTFAMFALGNRQYEHFCSVGRKVDHRLAELGGKRLLEHGEGDDDGSMDDDYSSWKTNFWQRTKQQFGLQNESAASSAFKPSFSLEWKPEGTKHIGGLTPAICDPKHKPILATVVANRELRSDITEGCATNEEGDSTRHLDLDVSALRLSYVTADNLGVCPRNEYKAAAQMIARLKVKADQVFTLKALGKKKIPVTSPCRVEDAMLWYLDFQTVPRAALLTLLAQYTDDEGEKEKLRFWSQDKDGKEEFHREERSLYEVLEELPHLNIPFLDFLELCPKLQPRFYTISSSSLVTPKQVSITVAKTTHHKTRGRVYHGIASTYLCALRVATPANGAKPEKKADQVCVFLRPSTFRLPKPKRVFVNGSPTPVPTPSPSPAPGSDGSAVAVTSPVQSTSSLPPIIMVGPGTGVAPFRAFIQEFHYLRSKGLPSFPSTHLFFGCRHKAKDWIYEDEMEEAVANESLTHLHTAFSRDTEQKVYVQTDLKTHAEQVYQLIVSQRAYFYVCGGTLMGRQIKECIQHIVEQHGNMTQQASVDYVQKMQKEGRYIQELWS